MRKTAAILAFAVGLAAAIYFLSVLYQNDVLLKSSLDAWDGIDDAPAMHYLISGGIAIVSLIAGLAIYPRGKP
jgi:hypothetical protein